MFRSRLLDQLVPAICRNLAADFVAHRPAQWYARPDRLRLGRDQCVDAALICGAKRGADCKI
jgi:hypothetical protein